MYILWNAAGVTALLLAGAGVVLPVLPTVPFVILAAFCFSKGSARLRNWLLNHPSFGPYIKAWEEHGAIPLKAKSIACIMMLSAFALSVWLGLAPWILLVQAICLSGAAIFVLSRPSQ